MSKKSILLAMPDHFHLNKLFAKNLEHSHFTVFPITFTDSHFKYKNFSQRLSTFIKKTLLGDKRAKMKLKVKEMSIETNALITTQYPPQFNYALIIRPDLFHESTLKLIRQRTEVMVAYQWDGFNRYPVPTEKINLFDNFYVFDTKDLQKKGHNFRFLTNFYFDCFDIKATQEKYDIIYLGSFIKNRSHLVHQIADECRQQKLASSLNVLHFGKPDKHTRPHVNYINQMWNYEEYLTLASQSKAILDLQNRLHGGFSFRVFEAIGLKKKLITTNPKVKQYDFYHPNNVFVLTSSNIHLLGEFINTPYLELSEEISHKYSFSNWINYVLGISPFQAIDYPKISPE